MQTFDHVGDEHSTPIIPPAVVADDAQAHFFGPDCLVVFDSPMVAVYTRKEGKFVLKGSVGLETPMYDRVLQIPKEQTNPVGCVIDGGAGSVEVRVSDYTNQHVATVRVGGARINDVQGYSADCYEVNVSKLVEAEPVTYWPGVVSNRLTDEEKRLLRPPYVSTNLALESHELRIGDLECRVDEDLRRISQRLARLEEISREHSHETDPLKGGKPWMPGGTFAGEKTNSEQSLSRDQLIDTISFRLACFDDEVYGEKDVTLARAAKFRGQAIRLIDELGIGEVE